MENKIYSAIKRTIVLFFTLTCLLKAQIYNNIDTIICSSKFKLAVDKNLENEPIGDVIASIGKSFIGTEYAGHTLERADLETLIINFSEMDCTTLLENSLAIARCIKEKIYSFENFKKELTKIRYRNGVINEYPSRLHYFSDWIFDNQEKGIIKNISEEIGGGIIKFNVNFMTSHPGFYLELKTYPRFIRLIEKQEKEISKREYFFISKKNVSNIEKKIHNGDLIALTSDIKGLDINHVGIAVGMDDGRIHLLHAPNVGYKVQITGTPLSDYLAKNKKDTGIIILRAVEPSEQVK
jgi:hypothetical protein